MFEAPGSTKSQLQDANLVPGTGKKPKRGRSTKTDKAPKPGRTAGGRKDGGIEGNPDVAVLAKRIKGGEQLYLKAQDAKEAYASWNKATAQAAGLMATVVAAAVKARCQGKYGDKKRFAEQLELVFSELGE